MVGRGVVGSDGALISTPVIAVLVVRGEGGLLLLLRGRENAETIPAVACRRPFAFLAGGGPGGGGGMVVRASLRGGTMGRPAETDALRFSACARFRRSADGDAERLALRFPAGGGPGGGGGTVECALVFLLADSGTGTDDCCSELGANVC